MTSIDRAINSAIATGIAECITLPICTLKTIYQNTKIKSIIEAVKHVYITSGIKGFYQASIPASLSQIFSTSSKIVLYKKFEDMQFPHTNKFINGIVSGIIVSLFTHPLDVVKVHWQMNDSIKNVLNVKLFYRGYSKTFGKISLGSALFLPLTDFSKKITNNNIVLSSLFSGFISTTIIHPIDYLKTRHIYGVSLYQGINPLVYYRGFILNLLRTVPHFTITMTGIEIIEKYRTPLP